MSDGPAKAIDKDGKKGKKKSGHAKMNWATYLYKIKGQVHPNLGMASDAMFVINGIVEDYKERMIKEAFKSAADREVVDARGAHRSVVAAHRRHAHAHQGRGREGLGSLPDGGVSAKLGDLV